MQEDWRIHVARDREGSKPRRQNVVGHRLTFKDGEVVVHDGVRVTAPARTWLDLAALLSVDELIAAGDSSDGGKSASSQRISRETARS
ncbi:hypothetical protein [Arthrobacter sp. SPG23]|uniref:hypothetical protein n=1 Tax=Arthrobacter sp. SPG23 TaxID=1610703 RepID=UPI000698FD5A|nr:hypothetical protein [Arthrobacter sp. SPG23]